MFTAGNCSDKEHGNTKDHYTVAVKGRVIVIGHLFTVLQVWRYYIEDQLRLHYYCCYNFCQKGLNSATACLLTLGAHAQEGYCSCLVCVCVSVCLSVTTLAATSFVFTLKSYVSRRG